jgi:HEAT repeat protein
MGKVKTKTKLVGVVLLLAVGLAAVAREPRHKGHPLRYWLHQYWNASEEEQKLKTEAASAVRAIGAKKAVPELLYLVSVKDGPVREWMEKNGEKYHIPFRPKESATDLQLDGITGFEILGTNAAFAASDLAALLKDKELAFVAVRCLDYLGKAAEPALCQAITNQDRSVREWALAPLASVTDTVELYVERIKPLLQDPDASVRCSALQAIGAQRQAPDLALPILVAALDAKDDGVARTAADQVGNFGTNALGAFSRLVMLSKGNREDPARAALGALARIAPSEAVGILSNTVVNGNPNLMHAAITQLRPLGEDLALRLLLEQVRSSDQIRRSKAVDAAGIFEATTPGLADALNFAATNSGPELSQHITMIMVHLVQKQRGKNGSRVDIPGEPSYRGKPLSEWLEMREREGGLATNAVRALNQMGTNVVPALLARLTYREPIFGLADDNVSMGAVYGLWALEEKAAPALPTLRQLMDDENEHLALRALVATIGAGKAALPCIAGGLTNGHAEVRSQAAGLLTSDWASRFSKAREGVTPQVIKLLDDPDRDVRVSVTNDLWDMDPKLATKLGIEPSPVHIAPGLR